MPKGNFQVKKIFLSFYSTGELDYYFSNLPGIETPENTFLKISYSCL